MAGYLVAAYRHKLSPRESETAIDRLAQSFVHPSLAALKRTWLRVKDKEKGHKPVTRETLLAYLRHGEADAVGVDSGRDGELVAGAVVQLGLSYVPDADIPAPLLSYVVVPHRDDGESAELVDPLVAIGEALCPVWGMMSVEPSYASAHNAALAKGPPKDERATNPLMTDDRIRYRRTPWYYDKKVDQVIGGPEWGTFLGPKHLEKLSLDRLRDSGAFFEVRPLSSGGAFVRVSESPADAQSNRILKLVAKARAALYPIVIDVSAVKI